MNTGPPELSSADLAEALGVGGLADSFALLPRTERIHYANWIESADSEEERKGRIKTLMRLLHVWSKAR